VSTLGSLISGRQVSGKCPHVDGTGRTLMGAREGGGREWVLEDIKPFFARK
jgi:hypothetical protein